MSDEQPDPALKFPFLVSELQREHLAAQPLFVIWSIEHNAWWRPFERGYTWKLEEAGVYTDERSLEIVTRANDGPRARIGDRDVVVHRLHECRIPATHVVESGLARRE